MRTPLITPSTPCGLNRATLTLECNCTKPTCRIRTAMAKPESMEYPEETNPLYATIPEHDDRNLIDWEEVEDSMQQWPRRVSAKPTKRWEYRSCPHCGHSETLGSLHYENDEYLWMLGCGRGGFLLVCLHCKFPLQFEVERMS